MLLPITVSKPVGDFEQSDVSRESTHMQDRVDSIGIECLLTRDYHPMDDRVALETFQMCCPSELHYKEILPLRGLFRNSNIKF